MVFSAVQFKSVATSDMVRDALRHHSKHQPVPNDDRMGSLLDRLAKAEEASRGPRDPSLGEGERAPFNPEGRS